MTKCVIYTRVSTTEQDNQSQIDDLKKYANNNSFKVLKTFGEKVSGYDLTKDRVEYDSMKRYVLDNDIKSILIWELSRLGRSTLSTLKEIDFFKKEGVNIFFKKENLNTISDNPTNNLLLNLLSSVAELERNTIVDRTARGMRTSAERGTRMGFGILPYGYEADNKKMLVINEEEAKVVQMMFEMYAKGTSVRNIATHLNSLKIPTRNTKRGMKRTLKNGKEIKILWQNNTVRAMLQRTLYKGKRHYSEDVIINVPAIVDEEVWNKVQECFKKNIGYITRTKHNYLFKGKMICGHCGLSYVSRTETRYEGHPSFYLCNGRNDQAFKCKAGQFSARIIDESIYNEMFKASKVPNRIYEEVVQNFNLAEKLSQIEFFRSSIVTLEGKRNKTIYLFKNDYISDSEFKSEQSSIRRETVELENKIKDIETEIENFQEVKNIRHRIRSITNEKDFSKRYTYTSKFADKIIIYNVKENRIEKLQKIQHRRDKMIYLEVYAFKSIRPVKVVLSSLSGISFSSPELQYHKGVITIE